VTPDACRPVEVTVDGQRETIRVHGGQAPSEQAVTALGQIVEAVRARTAAEPVTVRERALEVLREHFPAGDHCGCGAFGVDRQLWSWHLWRELGRAGVLATPSDPATPAAEQFENAQAAALRAHFPSGGRCACGRSAHNATLWSVHVLRALAEAGVTVPLDETAVAS
jgi:hypothetical protein